MSNIEPKTTEVGGVKVTLKAPESPMNSPAKESSVTDSLGRVIRLKKPRVLANLDFAKAAGGDRLNVLYLAEVAHLKYVAAIDDRPIATPSTEAELRALYEQLGDEGNEAAMHGAAQFLSGDAGAQAQEAELKNS